MKPYVFSMDSHVVEPRPLWQDGLPAHLRDRALRAERRDGYLVMTADGKDLHRMQIGDGNSDNPRIGGTNPELRFKDMHKDGIDAELLFPNLGMMCYAIDDAELSFACMQVYNDWLMQQFGADPDTFVPCAVLPMRDVARDARRIPARRRPRLPRGDAADAAAARPALQQQGLRSDLGLRAGAADPARVPRRLGPDADHRARPRRGDHQLHAAGLCDRRARHLHGRRRRARPSSGPDDGRHRGRRLVDGRRSASGSTR